MISYSTTFVIIISLLALLSGWNNNTPPSSSSSSSPRSFRAIGGVESIIFYQAQTTACDQCDRLSQNSMRNLLCCLKFSKCCLPDSLDEYNRRVKIEDDLYYGRRLSSPRSSSIGLNSSERKKSTIRKKTSRRKSSKKRRPTRDD
ncbi:hypothetical protein SSS_05042 [Sarcoptes scabiei]|nr:hypothetical protein SSS_05042 [Sarcoptes scabiei]